MSTVSLWKGSIDNELNLNELAEIIQEHEKADDKKEEVKEKDTFAQRFGEGMLTLKSEYEERKFYFFIFREETTEV